MDLIAYILPLLILICIYIILAVSLNLVLGYSGYLNLGHIALFSIGAYTSVRAFEAGMPYLLGLLLAGIVAGLCGFILIWATKKLAGDYYALATLGFLFVIYSLSLNLLSITNGPLGISGIGRPELFGVVMRSNIQLFGFSLVLAAITVGLTYMIVESPFGRVASAMRDNELFTKSLGKNTTKIKYTVMTLSAFFAGIAGSLFAHYISYIDPSSFYINELILVLTIVIIGGIASIRGSIIGAIIIVALPELLRFISMPPSYIGPARQILYGLILLIVLLIKPKGIFGRIDLP